MRIELSSTKSRQKRPRGAQTPGAMAPERNLPMQGKAYVCDVPQ
jgi:hypothetical protein